MLRTGLRDIEVTRANVGDVKPHSGIMVLFVHGKGRSEKDDFVVLANALLADINRYLDARGHCSPADPLFASTSNRNKGGRLTTRSVSGIVKQALRNMAQQHELLDRLLARKPEGATPILHSDLLCRRLSNDNLGHRGRVGVPLVMKPEKFT